MLELKLDDTGCTEWTGHRCTTPLTPDDHPAVRLGKAVLVVKLKAALQLKEVELSVGLRTQMEQIRTLAEHIELLTGLIEEAEMYRLDGDAFGHEAREMLVEWQVPL